MAKAMSTVSTSQVISSVASSFTTLPKKMTKEVIGEFLSIIESEIISGAKVRLDRVGILQTKDRAARKGRNPQTGEEIQIPASKKISFRVAKSLKEQVGAGSRKKTKR